MYNYRRRKTVEVNIGNTPLGGENPIRIQSMTNTSTLDTEGSVEQCVAIIEAGAHYVRLTAQGIREAERGAMFESYSSKSQELLTGTVFVTQNKNVAFFHPEEFQAGGIKSDAHTHSRITGIPQIGHSHIQCEVLSLGYG